MQKFKRKSITSFLKIAGLAMGLFVVLNGVNVHAAGNVAINPTNFPDAKFREFVKQYDTSKDGVLSSGEISQVTEMNCQGEDISSLKGIEFFTSLKTLNCTFNYLTGVDLSKNTALEQLDIGYHEEKIIDWKETNKIASLDLSKNTKLRWVSCEDLNMSSLNISNCTAIEDLACGYNQLTSLNVSKCTALSGLSCNDNKLTSLDVTKNTGLTGLSCGNNKLSVLDLSKNTQLSTLYCENNQISQIDVSKMTKLSILNCAGNKLKDLNIRNNKLLDLRCQKNQITTLVIGNNPNLVKAFNSGGTNVDGVMQYSYWRMYPVLDMGTLYVDASVNVVENEILPTGIKLNKTSVNMLYGGEVQLTATVSPSGATDKSVTWSTSDASIASVNNGVVKAKKAGKATITAKTVNGLTAQCSVAITMDNDPSNPFADLKAEGWQYNAAKYVYDNEYMKGKGEVTPGKVLFAPNDPIDRSQFVQTLYNVEGRPAVTYVQKFSDVKSSDWFAKPVTWAAQNQIVGGNPDGTFGVTGRATREQMARMFYSYAAYKGYDTSIVPGQGKRISDFSDGSLVSSWAETALNWALSHGVMSGKGDKLDPRGSATRAECATMIRNFQNTFKNAPLTFGVASDGMEEEDVIIDFVEDDEITENDQDVIVPEDDNKDVVAPEDDEEDVVTPKEDDKDVVTPEEDNKDVVAPENDNEKVITPEENNRDVIAPDDKNAEIISEE